MKSVTLNLGTAESVKHFVNVTNKFDYDMDLRSGRHVVDAKSILGIFSLDLSTPGSIQRQLRGPYRSTRTLYRIINCHTKKTPTTASFFMLKYLSS